MLSIIICSRKNTIPEELSKNICKTIGCEYQLVVIDNAQNQYSIFEAYNLGIERSNGAYLCFIHDDILFHTHGWGEVVNRIFEEDKKIGLLGIAGAKSKTKSPSVWWQCPEKHKCTNLIQHIPNKSPEKWITGFSNNSLEEVVVIDGVFMVLRSELKLSFSKKLKGYHNYDLNISFEVFKRNFKIVVTSDLLIEHFSLGNLNADWIESAHEIHYQYKNKLPFFLDEKNNREHKNTEWFLTESIKFKKSKIAFETWKLLVFLKPISNIHFKYIKYFLKVAFKQLF
jgi:glycosyltransferase involved in cell wall biosynthesis